MRRASETWCRFSLVALAGCCATASLGVHAATLTWDAGGATDALSDPLNWNPNQTPGLADDLVIGLGAFPFATADLSVRNIDASRTGFRNGQGFTFSDPAVSYRILVQDTFDFQTRNNSDLSLQIDGVSGTGLLAAPGLSLGTLILDNDNDGEGVASLKLNTIAATDTTPERGAFALVAGQVLVGRGGGVEGSGVLAFGGTAATASVPTLINNGQLVATYAGPPLLNNPPPVTELHLLGSIESRPIDLDGEGSERGTVRVEDNATLRIALPLSDPVSTDIEMGDGSVLWMERPWTLEDDLFAVRGPSGFASVPDVVTLRGAPLILEQSPTAFVEPRLLVAGGNRLVAEADVVMLDGLVEVGSLSVFEAAGELLLGTGTSVRTAGLLEVTGLVKVNDNAAVRLLGLGSDGSGLRVADGGTLEVLQGGGVVSEIGSTSTLDTEIAAGGTLRFARDFLDSGEPVRFFTPLTVDGRLEVEGDFGAPTAFGKIEALVGDLTLTEDATLTSIAGVDGSSRDFGTLVYSDNVVALDGKLELRIDAAAASDLSLLDGTSHTLFAGSRAEPEALLPEVLGSFDDVQIVNDLTGEIVAGLTATVGYNLPVGENALVTTVTFLQALALAGDFNGSGQVEQGDLNLVLNNWGGPRGAWFDADGFTTTPVDQEELNAVLNNWGAGNAPSFASHSAAVPEPALAVLAMGACGVLRCRRRR